MKRYKILISCYACSPYRGSEPGMGWNFVKIISKYHEVHVITEEKKWKPDLENYFLENPNEKENLKFHYILKKRNKKLRKIWPPSYYWFYKDWQKQAYQLAMGLDQTENYDIIHQLNMVGFREPGYLWKIDKPFVWGPIGGLEITPWKFLPSLGFKGMIHFFARNVINMYQRKILSRPKLASKKKNSTLIAATFENKIQISRLWGKSSVVMSEVGYIDSSHANVNIRKENEALNIVWSGLHEARKNLPLLLKALAHIDIDFKLHILGEGVLTDKWKKLANTLNIENKCIWYGWIPRLEGLSILQKGHLFCITSVHDLTSTVTLEALSYSLPVISLDICGFSEVINENCGIKIKADSPKKAILNFGNAIKQLYDHERRRQELSKGASLRAKLYSWDIKAKSLNIIYEDIRNESINHT